MKKIYYIGNYNKLENDFPKRDYSLAAAKKMDYIIECLNEIGYKVQIISPAVIKKNQKKIFCKTKNIEIAKNSLVLGPSFSNKNKLDGIIKVFLMEMWLIYYILKNINKNDTVILYHNYKLSFPLILTKKIKKFHLVLQIEELYQEIWSINKFYSFFEKKIIKEVGNNCLIVSEALENRLGKKDTAISYGNFKIINQNEKKEIDMNTIRLTYTGGIETTRKSAFIALEIMKFLPNNYYLNLSGPIDKNCEREFFSKIQNINKLKGFEACKYHGVLNDEDYKELLLNSDIGLNLQKEGNYSEYLFPSKIITYLSHNLNVISTPGESIIKSKIADYITITEDFNPLNISKELLGIDLNNKNNLNEIFSNINNDFMFCLKNILSNKYD